MFEWTRYLCGLVRDGGLEVEVSDGGLGFFGSNAFVVYEDWFYLCSGLTLEGRVVQSWGLIVLLFCVLRSLPNIST